MDNNKANKFNTIRKIILTFPLLILAECLLLTLVALIPKSAIHKNLIESADYLCENHVFFNVNEDDRSSRIDRYADSILLNISYNFESSNPLTSTMRCSYHFDATENENINLRTALSEKADPTFDYTRYWHGSISIVRPLLMIFNIEQIYIIMYVIIVALIVVLSILIKKHFGWSIILCFIISAIMTSIWYVPLSLEFTWTILIMLMASIICVSKLNDTSFNYSIFFFIVGNVTAYFDFLTTETLTLLLPMSLIVLHNHIKENIQKLKLELKKYIIFGVSWLAGYGLTWIAKWSLASIILNKNVFSNAINQASYRAASDVDNMSGVSVRLGAEIRNLSCLFPFSLLKENAFPFAIIFILVVMIIIYLIRKEKCVVNSLLLIIALIPYIRYFVLSNHSYMHYFFTFRAQLVTIFCLSAILVYGSDKALLSKEWDKLRRCLWKLKKN